MVHEAGSRSTSEAVTIPIDQLHVSLKGDETQIMGNDLVLGVTCNALEDSDDDEFEQEVSDEEEEEGNRDLPNDALLLPQFQDVLLNFCREQVEIEEVLDDSSPSFRSKY